ncbi:hypothetical protein Fmac_010700 [Flemingia macrophylla]|uniref:Uncharacterized protein n=1 Tax=Flemingia macrophylla TaxID=520843 RepID=A0ABD1MKD1_9FABA
MLPLSPTLSPASSAASPSPSPSTAVASAANELNEAKLFWDTELEPQNPTPPNLSPASIALSTLESSWSSTMSIPAATSSPPPPPPG